MTISTTRSKIRTIGSATLAAAVGLGMGALTIAAAPTASAAAVPIDKTMNYNCDLYINGGTSPFPADQIIAVQTATSLPDVVARGEVIPETPVQITLHMPEFLRSVSDIQWSEVRGSSSDTAVQFVIGGTPTPQEVLLQGMSADWMDIPDANWTIPVAGTVPAVTVPTTATGITVNAPSHFTINAEHKRRSGGANDTSILDCTIVDASQLYLGDILIEGVTAPTRTTLAPTAPSFSSATNVPATATLNVTPADATGTVKLSLDGKELATAPVTNGTASISVPADKLPTVGTFNALASYLPTSNHKPAVANVTLVRTAPVVVQDPEPVDAKIKATPKPKKFKVNKTAKLKIKIKSDSTSLAGKIKVKVGKKTIGKGKTNDAGKVTIKLKKIKKKYVKKGKIKLKVTYGGNEDTNKAKKTVKVKVKG